MDACEKIEKIVKIGTRRLGRANVSIYCHIDYRDGCLAISGVEGPMSNGNARGGCGQIVHDMIDPSYRIARFAAGWDQATYQRFVQVWLAWHLNDMRAGNARQRWAIHEAKAEGRTFAVTYPAYEYDSERAFLTECGLSPDRLDTTHPHYVYGARWLHQPVPEHVIAFLAGLPECATPAPWF